MLGMLSARYAPSMHPAANMMWAHTVYMHMQNMHAHAVHVHVHVHVYMCMCMRTCACGHVHVDVDIHAHAHAHVHVQMYMYNMRHTYLPRSELDWGCTQNRRLPSVCRCSERSLPQAQALDLPCVRA